MNPYTNEVVNTSLADLERQRQEVQARLASQATAAGAFGGSRAGVAQGITNRGFAQTAGDLAARLRSQGFDITSGLIGSDLNRRLAAEQGNQAAGIQAGAINANTALGMNQQKLGAEGLRLQAAGLLGNLGGQQQGMAGYGADILNRAGGQQQMQAQNPLDFAYQQFQEKRALPYENLDLLSRLLGSQQYGQTTTSRTTGTQPNPNRGSFLGTLGSLAGLIPVVGGAARSLLRPTPDWSSPQYAGAQ